MMTINEEGKALVEQRGLKRVYGLCAFVSRR